MYTLSHFITQIALAHAADADSPQVPLIDQMSMQQAFAQVQQDRSFSNLSVQYVQSYLLRANSWQNNCCTWRGVECVEGKVTAFVLTYTETGRNLDFRIGFLPHTTKFVHIAAAYLVDFDVRDIPRECRYVFIRNAEKKCITHRNLDTETFDAVDLPPQVEEFHIALMGPVWNRVVIRDLPQTLRFLYISNDTTIEYALIDSKNLPAQLVRIVVNHCRFRKKAKLYSMDGGKIDQRIRATNMNDTLRYNTADYSFYEKYNAVVDSINRDILES